MVENLTRTFGLEPVDFDGIRDAIGAQIRASGEILGEALNERALQIHLQRIVGAHVASAYGAAQFYGAKLSTAKDLTTRLGNDDRDEDRGGPSGFEDKAARAQRFAADMALQSYALRAAAEGAVLAYAEVTGETWKAYEAPHPHPPASAAAAPRSRWPHSRPPDRSRRRGRKAPPVFVFCFWQRAMRWQKNSLFIIDWLNFSIERRSRTRGAAPANPDISHRRRDTIAS